MRETVTNESYVIVRNISFDMFNKKINNLSLDEDTEIYDETVLEDQAIGNVNYDLLVDFIRSLPQGMRDAMYLKSRLTLCSSLLM